MRVALTTSGRRRRRRGRRRLAALTSLLIALVVAIVLVASSGAGGGGGGSLAGSNTATHADPPPRQHRARRPGHRPSRPTKRIAAIDAALRYTSFIARGIPRHRVVALTFDDGPSPYTPGIVRTLVRMHAAATFFVVGQQLTYFAAGLRDELRHGFPIGDHTENHAWLIRLSTALQYAQITADATALTRLGAPMPELFRPPYGSFDARTLAILKRLRMLMVMWSVDPSDWRRPGTKAIIDNVLKNARPGAIVELHDGGGDRSETLAALPAIINGLRRRHYTLVTLPQLLKLDPPPHHQQPPMLSGV